MTGIRVSCAGKGLIESLSLLIGLSGRTSQRSRVGGQPTLDTYELVGIWRATGTVYILAAEESRLHCQTLLV